MSKYQTAGEPGSNSTLRKILIAAAIHGAAAQFIGHGLPTVISAAGHGPATVGLVFVVYIPYLLRFLWSPIVDRLNGSRFGARKSWLVWTQAGVCFCSASYLLVDPRSQVSLLLSISFLLVAFASTQAVAISGFMIDALSSERRTSGVAFQTAGAGVAGLLIGVGILYKVGDQGWSSIASMYLIVNIVGLVALMLLQFDRKGRVVAQGSAVRRTLGLLRQQSVWQLILLLVLFEAPIAIVAGMSQVLQVQAGLSVSTIGLIGVVGGNLAAMFGAAFAQRCLAAFGARRLIAILLASTIIMGLVFAWSFRLGPQPTMAIVFSIFAPFIGFSYLTVSMGRLMAVCSSEGGATEISTLMCLSGILSLVLMAAGNAIAGFVGTVGLFLVAALLGAVGLVVVLLVKQGLLDRSTGDRPPSGPPLAAA